MLLVICYNNLNIIDLCNFSNYLARSVLGILRMQKHVKLL